MSTEITHYSILYGAGSKTPVIGLMNIPPSVRPHYLATLTFHPNGETLPANVLEVVPTATIARMHFHLEDFQNIVDILRNEKPIYLTSPKPGGTGDFYIHTNQNEPVGEGES